MYFKTDTRRPVQPEAAAGKEKHRPLLSNVHLSADKGEVWATDSYMAVRIPVEVEDGDTSGPIPLDALKAARKPPLKNVQETSIRLNSHAEVRMAKGDDASAPYLTVPREVPDKYAFPDLAHLWPEQMHPFEIGLNPHKLAALAKAMGCGPNDGVRLRFTMGSDREPSPLRPMVVEPLHAYGDSKPTGLLMPIRLM